MIRRANAFTGLNDSVGVLADNREGEIETSLEDAVAVVNRYQVLVDEAQGKTENVIEKLAALGALGGGWFDGFDGVADCDPGWIADVWRRDGRT